METGDDQGIGNLEAARANPEVAAARDKLVDSIKAGKSSAFLATRLERGARIDLRAQWGDVVTEHDGNSGYKDITMSDGLGFVPKRRMFEGMTSWALQAVNKRDLQDKKIISHEGRLETRAAGGPPMLVTLVTDRRALEGMGFDPSLREYCVIAAEVKVETNKMIDSSERPGISATAKYIVPTQMGEDIARLVEQHGPAAAWAILFDSAGYELNPDRKKTDLGLPTVDLGNRERFGVAYVRGSEQQTGRAPRPEAAKKKFSLFGQ